MGKGLVGAESLKHVAKCEGRWQGTCRGMLRMLVEFGGHLAEFTWEAKGTSLKFKWCGNGGHSHLGF